MITNGYQAKFNKHTKFFARNVRDFKRRVQ